MGYNQRLIWPFAVGLFLKSALPLWAGELEKMTQERWDSMKGLAIYRGFKWILNPKNGNTFHFYNWDMNKDGVSNLVEGYFLKMEGNILYVPEAPCLYLWIERQGDKDIIKVLSDWKTDRLNGNEEVISFSKEFMKKMIIPPKKSQEKKPKPKKELPRKNYHGQVELAKTVLPRGGYLPRRFI